MTQEIAVNDGGTSCAVLPDVGEEYLLTFYFDRDGEPWLDFCGLNRVWTSVSDEDKAKLETGCNDDPCEFACDEYQVHR